MAPHERLKAFHSSLYVPSLCSALFQLSVQLFVSPLSSNEFTVFEFSFTSCQPPDAVIALIIIITDNSTISEAVRWGEEKKKKKTREQSPPLPPNPQPRRSTHLEFYISHPSGKRNRL